MNIFPAIDIFEGQAVRLQRGDYQQMTIYSNDPPALAEKFAGLGAEHLHVVDLEGAKAGSTPNFELIRNIVRQSKLQVQVGGGIRDEETIQRYLEAGVCRVILGTVAVQQPEFLAEMVQKYAAAIAVGVDLKQGQVATHGWLQSSGLDGMDFCRSLQKIGVQTIICTDIAKDGMLQGANHALYSQLAAELSLNVIASGGVSSLQDVEQLNDLGIYGAILGKAIYTGDIDLAAALALSKGGSR